MSTEMSSNQHTMEDPQLAEVEDGDPANLNKRGTSTLASEQSKKPRSLTSSDDSSSEGGSPEASPGSPMGPVFWPLALWHGTWHGGGSHE